MTRFKLDYTLQTSQERKAFVENIVATHEDLTPDELETLADYLIFCMDKEERKRKKILTDNRMVTINKRETSYQALAEKFENGEDGVYTIVNDNKHTLFQPKQKITDHDIETMEGLAGCQQAIQEWQNILATATGKDRYIAKKALIEFRKLQYQIKSNHLVNSNAIHFSSPAPIEFEGSEWIDELMNVRWEGVSLCDPRCCSAILCNYSRLKQQGLLHITSDLWCIMEEFDDVSTKALTKYPLLMRITELKIDGVPNLQIQKILTDEFGTTHSLEYISSLWRKKIPNLIADLAQENFLNWYFTFVVRGTYKRCTRCGKIKLAHSRYFSKNSTSKDGFYSICKDCRNQIQDKNA